MGYIREKTLIKRGASVSTPSFVISQNWQKRTIDGTNDVWIYNNSSAVEELNSSMYVGYNTPYFHRRVKNGELIGHTPWKQLFIKGHSEGENSLDLDDGFTHYTKKNHVPSQDWMLTEDILASYLPANATSTNLAQEAAAKIYNSGHDTLTFLAEIAEIKHMYREVGEILLRGKLPLKWRQLNSKWLSGRYGWRTFIYDMKDLNKAITNLNDIRKRVSEKARSISSTSNIENYTVEKSYFFWECQKIDSIEVSLVGSVVADIETPKFQFNPLVTGWEIIPLSFVIDWFVSIGKSLAALSFLTLQTNYAASTGYRVTVSRFYSHRLGEIKSHVLDGFVDQVGSCEGTLECRTPCHVPLIPHFSVRLNAAKIVDLVALILQRI